MPTGVTIAGARGKPHCPHSQLQWAPYSLLPEVTLDVRYHTDNNFVGRRLDGYEAPPRLLTRPAAEALKRAQQALTAFNLRLVVFDGYRPQEDLPPQKRGEG